MNSFTRRTLFLLFFLSGFSSLIYQVIWTRMAFASFGIISPVLSVMLSVFMLGLAVGSWGGGRLINAFVKRTGISAVFFYGAVELLIGVGAFAVPSLFVISAKLLLPTGQMNSFGYLLWSALALGLSIFPWCVFMGATFPMMMAYVREQDAKNSGSFSYLYLANVLGAMTGTLLTALVLVELFGFHHTLWVAACGNFSIAIISFYLAAVSGKVAGAADETVALTTARSGAGSSERMTKIVLFSTGFVSMAMEVVWSRGFTPVLKTQVYSFAMIVFTYLGATFVGSLMYRRHLVLKTVRTHATLFTGLAMAAFLPVLINDPRVRMPKFQSYHIDFTGTIILLASIVPLCGLMGYLTPSLIDDFAGGNPRRAGTGYAINVLGCILGPLFGCYFLLPHMSGRYALIILALPFVAFWFITCQPLADRRMFRNGAVIACTALFTLFWSGDLEELIAATAPNAVVRRDYMASVVALGTDRDDKLLVVNGSAMTTLTPITKFMAHLPLGLHEGQAKSALVICFGMGTTYRSSVSWGVDTTVVELVPSVPQNFGFYFSDSEKFTSVPQGRIIIDDGRRYLSRCARKFDIIVVDPPPPMETAGSSLLFSREFYTLAKEHLNPNGIVAMWYPNVYDHTCKAVVRSMAESFPHMRCYDSVERWGMHMFASMSPLPKLTGAQMAAKMPPAAIKDLMEWTETPDPAQYLAKVVDREYPVAQMLNRDAHVEVTDDRPFNEYYLIRDWLHPAN